MKRGFCGKARKGNKMGEKTHELKGSGDFKGTRGFRVFAKFAKVERVVTVSQ